MLSTRYIFIYTSLSIFTQMIFYQFIICLIQHTILKQTSKFLFKGLSYWNNIMWYSIRPLEQTSVYFLLFFIFHIGYLESTSFGAMRTLDPIQFQPIKICKLPKR